MLTSISAPNLHNVKASLLVTVQLNVLAPLTAWVIDALTAVFNFTPSIVISK